MAEPFTDAELYDRKEHPGESDLTEEEFRRFLATITARDKRIEGLEEKLDDAADQMVEAGTKHLTDLKLIADQTATIERLRGVLENASMLIANNIHKFRVDSNFSFLAEIHITIDEALDAKE